MNQNLSSTNTLKKKLEGSSIICKRIIYCLYLVKKKFKIFYLFKEFLIIWSSQLVNKDVW